MTTATTIDRQAGATVANTPPPERLILIITSLTSNSAPQGSLLAVGPNVCIGALRQSYRLR